MRYPSRRYALRNGNGYEVRRETAFLFKLPPRGSHLAKVGITPRAPKESLVVTERLPLKLTQEFNTALCLDVCMRGAPALYPMGHAQRHSS